MFTTFMSKLVKPSDPAIRHLKINAYYSGSYINTVSIYTYQFTLLNPTTTTSRYKHSRPSCLKFFNSCDLALADRKYTRGRCQQSCVSYTVKLVDNVDNMASLRRSLFSRNSSYDVDVRMKVGVCDHGLRGQAGSVGVLERVFLGGEGRGGDKCWVKEGDMLSFRGFPLVLVFCFLCLFTIVGDLLNIIIWLLTACKCTCS